jgi:hypothetical protein
VGNLSRPSEVLRAMCLITFGVAAAVTAGVGFCALSCAAIAASKFARTIAAAPPPPSLLFIMLMLVLLPLRQTTFGVAAVTCGVDALLVLDTAASLTMKDTALTTRTLLKQSAEDLSFVKVVPMSPPSFPPPICKLSPTRGVREFKVRALRGVEFLLLVVLPTPDIK